jgi:hypothetical protein
MKQIVQICFCVSFLIVQLSVVLQAADNFSDRRPEYSRFIETVDKTFNILVMGEQYYRRDPATGIPLTDETGAEIVDNSRLLHYPSGFYTTDLRYLKALDVTLNEEDIYTPDENLHVPEADEADYATHTQLAQYAEITEYAGYVPATVTSVRFIKEATDAINALVATSIDYNTCPPGRIDINSDITTSSKVPSPYTNPKCVYSSHINVNLHAYTTLEDSKTYAAMHLFKNVNQNPQYQNGPFKIKRRNRYQYTNTTLYARYLVPYVYDNDGNPLQALDGIAYVDSVPVTVSARTIGTAYYRHLRGNSNQVNISVQK